MFDMHFVTATTDSQERYTNPLNCESYITYKEIWTKAPKATARKATAKGVNHITIKETDGDFYIFQISGYTPERGIYCDLLDRSGRVVKTY